MAISDLLIDGTPFAAIDSALALTICEELPSYARALTIPATVRRFAVEFALLNYENTAATQYAYRLDGYNDDWQYVPATVRTASFDRLPSGHYTLRLKAADSHGVWTEMPYPIDIRVLPPWYATWWAYLIYICVFAALARLGWNYWQMQQEVKASRRFSTMLHLNEEPRVKKSEASDSKTIEAHSGAVGGAFLSRATQLIRDHLNDTGYNRDRMAEDLNIGVTSLYTRLKEATGLSPQTFIQTIRLNAACDILQREPDIRISELAYRVGFNTPKYFSQCFKKAFGMLPAEYVRQKQE